MSRLTPGKRKNWPLWEISTRPWVHSAGRLLRGTQGGFWVSRCPGTIVTGKTPIPCRLCQVRLGESVLRCPALILSVYPQTVLSRPQWFPHHLFLLKGYLPLLPSSPHATPAPFSSLLSSLIPSFLPSSLPPSIFFFGREMGKVGYCF